jgi:hypothetical protein
MEGSGKGGQGDLSISCQKEKKVIKLCFGQWKCRMGKKVLISTVSVEGQVKMKYVLFRRVNLLLFFQVVDEGLS